MMEVILGIIVCSLFVLAVFLAPTFYERWCKKQDRKIFDSIEVGKWYIKKQDNPFKETLEVVVKDKKNGYVEFSTDEWRLTSYSIDAVKFAHMFKLEDKQ